MSSPPELKMETANPEQAAAWNGREGEHWAEHADRFEQIGDACWQRLLAGLPIATDARVLDVGCGTGKSTRDLGRVAANGTVLGIDLSAPMLTVARERTAVAGLGNVTFVQGDAQVHRFDADALDAVVSCFGAMFFADPVAAFANLRRAMRSGATLGLLVWRELHRNEWLTAIRGALAVGRELPLPPPDAPTPFSMADPGRVDGQLAAAGFDHVERDPVDEPLTFGEDVDDAFEFIRTMGIVDWLTHDLDPAARTQAFDNLRAAVDEHLHPGGVSFNSSAWIITATS